LAGAFPLGALAPGNASSLSQGKTSVLETHLLDTSVIDPMTLERLNRLDIHASIAVPLMKDGMLTGVLCATDGHSRAWSPDDIALAEEVAERTWEEIDRVRGGRELERRAETATAERDRIWRMSRDIMAVASLNGYFLSVNPAFTAALGWSQQEATAIPLMELTHPEHREDLAQKLGVLAQGLPLVRYEIRDLHKDGSHRWLSWTIVPEGDLLYGVARDITDEKRQSGALRHAEDALRQSQKMEAVGQLTGGIAHDFNNLLASMVGNLEMTKARIGQGYTGDLARYIDRALIVADRAAALTHRLLAFSRRQTLDSRPTDVNRLVASMGNLIQRTVGPAIQVDTRLPDGLWNTLCDPNQLESALLNLAINARDAMPGGGRLKIETSNIIIDEVYAAEYPGIVPGEYVAISVTDTGTGMPPDVLARAFDPFFTTKPLGQGTGLGLSMIYGFAKQSGGQIRIYSEQGKGTTVRLKLPRHLGEAEAGPAISTLAGMPQATKNRTILLVDDEADLRNLLAEMLEMLGYSTIEAADGAEGMRILESSQRVDLLVTDVGLPGDMNGRKLAEAARMSRPGLQVLFITGYAENVAAGSELLASGMQLMTKPFGIDAFAARVRSMIDATQARHERGQERG
jgi:PAS domain S-box-containing protein